jgi:hypothetical protein
MGIPFDSSENQKQIFEMEDTPKQNDILSISPSSYDKTNSLRTGLATLKCTMGNRMNKKAEVLQLLLFLLLGRSGMTIWRSVGTILDSLSTQNAPSTRFCSHSITLICASSMFYYYTSQNKKVKLSLCLTKHHAMKVYWGSAGIAPRILCPQH